MQAQHHVQPYDLDLPLSARSRETRGERSLTGEEDESLWAPVSPTLGASTSALSSLPARIEGAVRSALDGAQEINVRSTERVVSAVIGGLLVARGLSSQGTASKALALLGSGLVYRGLSGHCHLYQALGVNTADQH